MKEAHDGAKLLKEAGYTFDVAYTSTLQRAIKTLWIILEEMHLMYIPIINTWRLNERHYGGTIISLVVAMEIVLFYSEDDSSHLCVFLLFVP